MNGFSLINFRFAKETTKMEKIEPYIWFHALFIGSGSTPRDRHFFVQTNSPLFRNLKSAFDSFQDEFILKVRNPGNFTSS